MTDRLFLWLALAFYATGGVLMLRRLFTRSSLPTSPRAIYATMFSGFLLHTAFLFLRGQGVGRCPLTNLFETQAFVAWALVLFYLVVGPAYRLSFLGAFTAPLVLVICLAALLMLSDEHIIHPETRSAWVEFHAAIAILAYGAFALAFVTGSMYLLQERQLKSRRLTPAFLQLPSIEQLDQINLRLILIGFVMLTVGVVGGFISYSIVGHATHAKMLYGVVVWLVYAALLAARLVWSWRGRKVAIASMLAFALVLIAFWGISL